MCQSGRVSTKYSGGTTQFVITWLLRLIGDPLVPAWYVAGASMLTVAAALALPESGRSALRD